jgi:YegS/Rv2252/BmrU family lipid kinase
MSLATTPHSIRSVVAIFNPVSGQGAAPDRRAQLETALAAAGARFEVHETQPDAPATELAREAVSEGADLVLACGGDGTVMEAATGLVGQHAALGIVPAGTGNLFALNLQIPTAIPDAVHAALNGERRSLDVGRRGDATMVMMAGIGWDAHMVRDASRELKNRIGMLAYFWAAIRNLRRPPERFMIELDDRPPFYQKAKSILVANLGRITGGLLVVPDADPSDGYLDVAVITAETLFCFAGLCASTLFRRLPEDPRVTFHRVRRVRITARHPQAIQFDGNDMGSDRVLELEVVPGALQVMVPRGSEESDATQ